MPSPRLDSTLVEYQFTEAESLHARMLSSLHVMWLQTKFAILFKEKASQLIPENSLEDRSFLLKLGNIEGRLEMLQELLQDCIAAQRELALANIPGTQAVTGEQAQSFTEIKSLSDRASNQVHNVS